MSIHARVRLMLYEYVRNELSIDDRTFVEMHLTSCKSCALELQHIEDAAHLVTISAAPPSEERTDQYWQRLADTIVEAVGSEKGQHRNPTTDFLEWIEHIRIVRPKYIYALGGSLAVCLVVLAFWTFYTPATPEFSSLFHGTSKPLRHVVEPVSPETYDRQYETGVPAQRVSQYFRKSKTLLVGIANLNTEPGDQLDLSTERRVSRDLIREARYLKQQPIDPRSRHLMNELERILIELENIKQHNNLPNVEIVRSGIHHENLLFKIRMAEAMYDSNNVIYASERR